MRLRPDELAPCEELGGRTAEAVAALERYERKENLVSAERTRARLRQLEPAV